MRILITGATGLVGSAIVEQCHKNDIAVNYLTTSKKKIASEPDYKGFYWNPNKGEIDLECFEGVTAIINLAGASISKRWTLAYRKKIISSRVNSLRTLHSALEKVDHQNILSFVSASAIGVYPDSLSRYYTEEEKAVDDSFLGEVVKVWEEEIDKFKSFSFSVAKVRIGLVMSCKGGALPEMAKPVKLYLGAAFGSGEQWQSWIHISDLARIFIFVLEHGLSGVYNGVGPNPVTNAKLVKEIAKVFDRPLWLPNIPKFVMRLLLGKMSYILFASQRVSCKKIEEEGFSFEYPNVCVALEGIYKSAECADASGMQTFNKEYVS
ncbi:MULTISPECIES: TIGR01777 family oxidoreductase [Zobellia]|uniref:NAD(P)-dependent epimerase/dehydratase n=1 Tax=Zobellia galactanivorans (strain DSM 12802 / CCUG 47099 / CIP 106680 / NCIMB 13871 / Dsij) TaxID=63186 RepID=G0LCJ9_ZOBGA|nr:MULTISPECIES: TIGR01777 family oxidoreductase [Zobellia]MBU3025429.1 TIGR01777 family oxidoreductase [Zobellia galactanivorans]OWW25167.1 TIGR01777 family protein [Zobellia sp. OII3]CAZ96969.1 NAD(P)-dependent epimerase/dehydratase [Zobellia galactanivorans]